MPEQPKVFIDWNDAVQSLGQASAQALANGLTASSHQIERAIAHILRSYELLAEQAKRIGEHCACNWFVARAMGGGWIHEDGTECAGAACTVSDPDRHNIIVDLRRVIAAQEAALDMTEERREIKRLEQVNATLKAALRRAPCEKRQFKHHEHNEAGEVTRFSRWVDCGQCPYCLARAEQPEGDGHAR